MGGVKSLGLVIRVVTSVPVDGDGTTVTLELLPQSSADAVVSRK